MATLGDLVVNLTANSNPLTNGLERSRASISQFASSALKALAPLAGAFTFAKLVESASEAEVEVRKLEGVLRATGGAAGVTVEEISKFSDARMAVTDFNDELTKSAASILASFKTITGPEFFRTLELAQDLSVVMGTDMTSATKALGKALADPAAGLSKLSKLGITFTEQQKEMVKTMQESGDMAGAQGVILDALAGKFGGAAEAVSTPIARMKNMFGELAEMLGKVFLPSVELITGAFSNLVAKITMSSDGTAELGSVLKDIIGPALDVIVTGGGKAIGVFIGLQSGVSGLTAKFAKLRAAGAQLDVWTGGGEEAQQRLDFWNNFAATAQETADQLGNTADRMVFGDGSEISDAVRQAQRDLEARNKNLPAIPPGALEPEDDDDAGSDAPGEKTSSGSGGGGGSDPMWSKTLIEIQTTSRDYLQRIDQNINKIALRAGANEVEDIF